MHILIALTVLLVLTATMWGRRVLLVCAIAAVCGYLWPFEILGFAQDLVTPHGSRPVSVAVAPAPSGALPEGVACNAADLAAGEDVCEGRLTFYKITGQIPPHVR